MSSRLETHATALGAVLLGAIAACVMHGTSEAPSPSAELTVNRTYAVKALKASDTTTTARVASRASRAKVRPTLCIRPVPGAIGSGFGMRDGEFHAGLDFLAPYAQPVFAVAAGMTISPVGTEGYGNVVEISHAKGVASWYAHLSSTAVRPGTHVNKGQLIGYVGNTGRSHGAHLHFEIRQNGRQIDPAPWLTSCLGHSL